MPIITSRAQRDKLNANGYRSAGYPNP